MMPKIVDHAAYKAELIEKAALVFSERGYAAVTMRQLARGLGCSTGTIYHYFDSKEALFEAVVASIIERNVSTAMETLGAEGPATPRQVLDYMIGNEHRSLREFYTFLDYLRLNPERHEMLRPMLKQAGRAYAQSAATLLGMTDPAAGEIVLAVLMNIIEKRWFEGEVDAEPQLRLLQQFVDAQRGDP